MALSSTSANRQHRGGVRTQSIADGAVTASKLSSDILGNYVLHYNGKGQPLLLLADMSALASGADGVEHIAILPGGQHLHYWPIGASTIVGPMQSGGLDLTFDQTVGEGVNYVPGGSEGPHAIGAPNNWMIRVEATIMDKRIAHFAVGFRKNEAKQAAIDNYDELAALNCVAGDIKTYRILNNAATTVLDTTLNWADTEKHVFEVHLFGRKVYFFVDGAEVGVPHTFDDEEALVPFIYLLQSANPSQIFCSELKVGPISQFDATPGRK